jgi:aminopeptidase YwaD
MPMTIDWANVDRWLTGEAWVNSRIARHLEELCDGIGPRWASTPEEARAAEYIRSQMETSGLADPRLEEFDVQTWSHGPAIASIEGSSSAIPLLPYLFCPSVDLSGPLVDAGFGTAREVEGTHGSIRGAIAIVDPGFEPFTAPVPFPVRLQELVRAGARAVIAIDRKTGGRMEYHPATDWRTGRLDPHPVPTVNVGREAGLYLRRRAAEGRSVRVHVETTSHTAPAANTVAELRGSRWPDRHIVLGGHHDTVWGSPGGNDNASGTVVVMETARVLAKLAAEQGTAPGCTIRFATFSAEEQLLQGSSAFVRRHYGPEPLPLLMINLDELSTGNMKGVVLQFPELRGFVQEQLDTMRDGLACHVMTQLDAWSDHYPFSLRGIPSAILWRWRFFGRYPEADYHHEPGDTLDKVRIRDLKEYVGMLARLLLRFSHVAPEDWPANTLDPALITARIPAELNRAHRTFH